MDTLGLDAPDEGFAPSASRSRRSSRTINKQLPAYFDAVFPRDGQSEWRFRMLVERGHKAPCIEATEENFKALFELVSSAAALAEPSRRRQSRRSPRGEPGSREYWVDSRQCWVKIMEEVDPANGSKKRRQLSRRASNSAVLPLVDPSDSPSPRRRSLVSGGGEQKGGSEQDQAAEDLFG